MIKYLDTHAHINLPDFREDYLDVIERCRREAVAVINVGTNFASSQRAVGQAEDHEHLFAIIGLHPIYTTVNVSERTEVDWLGEEISWSVEDFSYDDYKKLAASHKVVGIGECGFDYWHTPKDSYEKQEENFIKQIELANELNLPLMIHTRGPRPGHDSPTGRSVYADVYDVLKRHSKVSFNVHFYAGSWEEAKRFFDLGGTISFTGVITFADDYEEVVRKSPLELIHAETDSPFVAPAPYRGRRCTPTMVKQVYKKIAEIKGLDEEMVRCQLLQNAKLFYSRLSL